VAPIYPAGEDPIPGVDAGTVVREIQSHGHPDCAAAATLDDLPGLVRAGLREGDLVLTLGAGNIYQAGEALLRDLAAHGVGARA
jgi:UDP-N-acetylmuramate--alanine ligase